jgi:hypothetical protein
LSADFVRFWDAAFDSQNPEASPIWNHFGTSGNCFTIGTRSLNAVHPQPHCVSRNFGTGSITFPEAMSVVMNERNMNVFRTSLEASIHATVHNWIGGDMGGMESPNGKLIPLILIS